MADREELAAKVAWMSDHMSTMDGKSVSEFIEALVRMSGGPGGKLVINTLSDGDADELDRLCDAAAADNGHSWGKLEPPGDR